MPKKHVPGEKVHISVPKKPEPTAVPKKAEPPPTKGIHCLITEVLVNSSILF